MSPSWQHKHFSNALVRLAWLLLLLNCHLQGTRAEISNGNRQNYAEPVSSAEPPHFVDDADGAGGGSQRRCHAAASYNAIAHSIDDMEDLELDVPINIAFDNKQKKRFSLYLNSSTPLTVTFSQSVARRLYYNQSELLHLSPSHSQHANPKASAAGRPAKSEPNVLVMPCALRGQYDLFVQARHRGSIKVEAHAEHPQASWLPVNFTHSGHIRNQNRVRRRQMIVKWGKSKFDFHAVHYCLVLSSQRGHRDFCPAIEEYANALRRLGGRGECAAASVMELLWLKPFERASKIDPHGTNIICTGSRTKIVLRGLTANKTYFIDIFGVHTKRQNFTFHIASKVVKFSRTHPVTLRGNVLSEKKIAGPHGPQVFSFKIPQPRSLSTANGQMYLRYLVLPCDGSEVNATILKKRKAVAAVGNIYRPTYIRLPIRVLPGERYIARFKPSNKDEVLRASRVGLAVTLARPFSHLPELPENITVFEVRSQCKSTTIAWYASPENRPMSYCIIVFNLPQRNRSSIDYTNYCMDFGKSMTNKLFHSIKCNEAKSSSPLETHTILNLNPGESYLVYVTAKLLSNGKPLPYQSLQVNLSRQCYSESRELNSYY